MEAQSKIKPRLPLKEIDAKNKQLIRDLNGEFLNLYRVLGHHEKLLSAWIHFAYTLRRDCTTTRELRELMILRGAQIEGSAYEWHQHRRWAHQQGVPAEQIEDLLFWRESPRFSDAECAALALTESMLEGDVPDTVVTELKKHYSNSEIVELALTAGFYAMVPRILNALKVPIEEETLHGPIGTAAASR
ncbi:MAG TPA: carboxymuconolactone decarboxylase family protein [Casimicrobiaceae bacterium]|nr:carboxymuconolactone decarboxylase family protein [Casimicrobiaceae bacterium]